MSQGHLIRTLLRFGARLCGILLVLFLVMQLAPGGPVDRFFFDLYEAAIMRDASGGPIR
jgi:ABC-type microcin C transport system permease subunit YejB